jgi:type VI secretion system secreted protein Hcp
MSNDAFVKIDGITGESQDEAHAGEIDVANWNWSMHQLASMNSGSGGGAGKATVDDLVFFHKIDRASPTLMTYCLGGKRIRKAVLTLRKASGVPFDYLRITMSDVVITAVKMNGTFEEVHLSFALVKQEYMVQSALGGSQGVVTGSFDIKFNTARSA